MQRIELTTTGLGVTPQLEAALVSVLELLPGAAENDDLVAALGRLCSTAMHELLAEIAAQLIEQGFDVHVHPSEWGDG